MDELLLRAENALETIQVKFSIECFIGFLLFSSHFPFFVSL